ncbi:MAG: DUF5990 family protein [Caldilineaceae bacterium]
MAANATQPLLIRLRCIELPGCEFDGRSNVRLGIQKGKDVIEDVSAAAAEIVFTCLLRVAKNSETGKPNFLGPYAQGTPQARFIYLCWGERMDGAWAGFGRTKIHLQEIPWHSVEASIATGNAIEATIKMTNKKGAPLFASVGKENITWKL